MYSSIETASDLYKLLESEVQNAESRIRKYVRETPLHLSASLTRFLHEHGCNANVYMKLECEQVSGSFKVRGALNKILSMSPEERAKGVVSASSGNHAIGLGYARSILPLDDPLRTTMKVRLPGNASKEKIALLEAAGVPVEVMTGVNCCGMVEDSAHEEAIRTGKTYVSPYDDLHIIAGQGTVGVEIDRQLRTVTYPVASTPLETKQTGPLVVLVPVGGGGLACGISIALRSLRPYPHSVVIGVQPSQNACITASMKVGKVATEEDGTYLNGETLADGVAGGIQAQSKTLFAFLNGVVGIEGVKKVVDSAAKALQALKDTTENVQTDGFSGDSLQLIHGTLLVSEDSILNGIRFAYEKEHKIIEPSSALSLAPLLLWPGYFQSAGQIVTICSGSNVQAKQYLSWVQ